MQSCWKRSRRLALMALVTAGILAAQLRPQASTEASRQVFLRQFAAAALDRTQHAVRYDPAYVRLAYPGGDVPAETGVCTDEVIRAYRALGIDLQKEVHEDMAANFATYPKKWRRNEPDSNIDHRRVPNLMVFFSRKGESLPISDRADDFAPGDLVTWDLGRGLTHIGMVVDRKTLIARRYMIVHNIGEGPKLEDALFNWKITGHYRYFGPALRTARAKMLRDQRTLHS
jgi:uncharacterized protein YijF (DUF1287 family)